MPTLVQAGDNDPFAAEPARLADALPNGTLAVVPGDHMMAVVAPSFHAALVDFAK